MGSAGTGVAPPERVSSTNQLSIDEGPTEDAWNSTREMCAQQNSNFSMRATMWEKKSLKHLSYQWLMPLVRSEGLEPPRFYSLPPQGSASTNSATSAWDSGSRIRPDQRRRCNKSTMGGQGPTASEIRGLQWVFVDSGMIRTGRGALALCGDRFSGKIMLKQEAKARWRHRALARARGFGQHLLDLDRDAVAVDQHHAAGDRQVVGQHLDLVGLGRVQFDDGTAGQ